MRPPVHFDLDNLEKAVRESYVRSNQQMLALKPDEQQLEFNDMQNRTVEIKVAAVRHLAGARNDHRDPVHIGQALAHCFYEVAHSIRTNLGEKAYENFLAVLLADLNGELDTALIRTEIAVQGTRGGRA